MEGFFTGIYIFVFVGWIWGLVVRLPVGVLASEWHGGFDGFMRGGGGYEYFSSCF